MMTATTPSSASIRLRSVRHSLEVDWWRPREGMRPLEVGGGVRSDKKECFEGSSFKADFGSVFGMKKFRLGIFALLVLLPTSLWAGSRGVSLAFLDATTGARSEASLRLAELLENDMRSLYLDPELDSLFPWNELGLKLQVLKAAKGGSGL